MDDRKLKDWLKSVGKRIFVQCFELFLDNYNALKHHEIATLMPQYDLEGATNNPINTLPRKASYAIDIFKKGRQLDALRLCINAKKIPENIKDKAQEFFDKYSLSPDKTNNYQELIEKNGQKNFDLKEINQNIPVKKISSGEKYVRDLQIAYAAKVLSSFKCEIDNNHQTFISKYSNQNFVESHHLIPMKNQNDFKHSIDIISNIIALCPNCHRAIHNANKPERDKLLIKLFNNRKTNLLKQGISLSIDDLINMYN